MLWTRPSIFQRRALLHAFRRTFAVDAFKTCLSLELLTVRNENMLPSNYCTNWEYAARTFKSSWTGNRHESMSTFLPFSTSDDIFSLLEPFRRYKQVAGDLIPLRHFSSEQMTSSSSYNNRLVTSWRSVTYWKSLLGDRKIAGWQPTTWRNGTCQHEESFV